MLKFSREVISLWIHGLLLMLNERRQALGYNGRIMELRLQDGNSYVFISFGAPDNGSLNVSNSENIVIQMGNGAAANQKHS